MKKKYLVNVTMEIEHELEHGEFLEDVLSDKFFRGVDDGKCYKVNVTEIKEPNFIRMINKNTGEVRETDANIHGLSALKRILKNDIKTWYNDKKRNPLNNYEFEGHSEFTTRLRNHLKKLLN